jgi:hypothetical protein
MPLHVRLLGKLELLSGDIASPWLMTTRIDPTMKATTVARRTTDLLVASASQPTVSSATVHARNRSKRGSVRMNL